MSKNMMEPEGPQMTEQYGCVLDKPRYTRARTCARPRDRAHQKEEFPQCPGTLGSVQNTVLFLRRPTQLSENFRLF